MNEKKFSTLTTEYADRMDNNIPWNEYPRPFMVRGTFLCLNGYWDFQVSSVKSPREIFCITEEALQFPRTLTAKE